MFLCIHTYWFFMIPGDLWHQPICWQTWSSGHTAQLSMLPVGHRLCLQETDILWFCSGSTQELLLPTQKHLGGDRHTYIDTQRWYFVLYFILCVHALHETMHPALARMQGRYLCTELQNWFATSSPHNKTTLWLLVLALNWCANILRIISILSVSSSLCEWSRMSPCHGAKAQD